MNGADGMPLSNGLRAWKTAGQSPGVVIGVQAKLPAPVPGFAVSGCAALISVVHKATRNRRAGRASCRRLQTAIGKTDPWSKIVLVGVRQIASTGRIFAGHLDGARRRIEVALAIETFGRRREDVVTQSKIERQIGIDLPIVLHEERHLFTRLQIWTTRIAAADETRLITKQEIGERRAGIVRSNAVVVAGNETAVGGAVLIVAFRAVVAATVVVTVLS